MDVINLPIGLKIEEPPCFKIVDYHTSQESLKQMVSLQLNTFSFLLEGNKEVFSDKASISIGDSSFLLMRTGRFLMTEKIPSDNNGYRSILFFVPDEAIQKFIQKHKIQSAKRNDHESVYSFQYDNFLKTFVNGLIDISKLKSEIQGKLLELKFEELMLYLKETRGTDFIFSLVPHLSSQVQRFIEIVEANRLNRLSLKELAFLSNMSVSTFKREFEKHFHSSPSKWFQEKRLEHSALLLKHKLKRPSDIFEEVGYENLSNFIQAFKMKFGVTPKQYQSD